MSQYSIWLLPAAAHEIELLQTMAQLRVTLGGDSFAPHVTIQGELALPLEKLNASLPRLAASLTPQRWRVQGVEISEHFFRSLVLRFGDEPVFASLQAATQALSGGSEGLSPYPHLSLSYGPAHPEKARLRQQLAQQFVGQEILFDRLAVTRSSSAVAISQWESLSEQPLGAA